LAHFPAHRGISVPGRTSTDQVVKAKRRKPRTRTQKACRISRQALRQTVGARCPRPGLARAALGDNG